MVLQVGNMRNVAPYEGNPVLEFLLSFKPVGIIVGLLLLIIFLFIVFSFFSEVIPELFGRKGLTEYTDNKKSQFKEISSNQPITYRLYSNNIEVITEEQLKSIDILKAQIEICYIRELTNEKFGEYIKSYFDKPKFSNITNITKAEICNAMELIYSTRKKHGWMGADNCYNENKSLYRNLAKMMN